MKIISIKSKVCSDATLSMLVDIKPRTKNQYGKDEGF